jgi:HAD superfamily hydrolase (TIGR01509 family)
MTSSPGGSARAPRSAVIFDVGFVFLVVDEDWAAGLSEEFAIEARDIGVLINAAETELAGRRFTIADLEASVAEQLRERLGDRAEDAAQRIAAVYADGEIPAYDEAMLELTRDLAAAGVPVGMLTNAPADWETGSMVPIVERGHIDAAVLSGRDGVGKPDPAAFDLLLQRLGVTAADACFIDDQASHAQAAEALGIASFVYGGDAAAVRDWLRSEGVPLPA